MNDSTAIELLNGLSKEQKAKLNLTSKGKIYSVKQGLITSRKKIKQVADLDLFLNSKTEEYLKENIYPSLGENSQFSGWPC